MRYDFEILLCKICLMPDSQNDIAVCPLCGSSGRFIYTGRDLLLNRSETYRYYQCIQCDAVYQHPTPDADTIASFYPETYSVYGQERQPKKRRHLENAVLKSSYGYDHLRVPLLYRSPAPKQPDGNLSQKTIKISPDSASTSKQLIPAPEQRPTAHIAFQQRS